MRPEDAIDTVETEIYRLKLPNLYQFSKFRLQIEHQEWIAFV
jgi:hypothetical protein